MEKKEVGSPWFRKIDQKLKGNSQNSLFIANLYLATNPIVLQP
jgi:hypothetical protein